MRASYWLFIGAVGIALLASGIYIFSLWRLSPPEVQAPRVPPPQELSPEEILTQGEWQLGAVTRNGSTTIFSEPRIKIAFTSRRIAGEFCNIFTGPVTIGAQSFTLSKVESTLRACENSTLMEAERVFAEPAELSYRIENGTTLIIFTPSDLQLIFKHGQ